MPGHPPRSISHCRFREHVPRSKVRCGAPLMIFRDPAAWSVGASACEWLLFSLTPACSSQGPVRCRGWHELVPGSSPGDMARSLRNLASETGTSPARPRANTHQKAHVKSTRTHRASLTRRGVRPRTRSPHGFSGPRVLRPGVSLRPSSCCPSNFFLCLLSLPVPGGSHVLQGGGRLASPDFHGPSAAECRGEGGADRPRLCPPAPAPRAPAAPRVLCCTPDAGPALAARSPDTCPVCSAPRLSFAKPRLSCSNPVSLDRDDVFPLTRAPALPPLQLPDPAKAPSAAARERLTDRAKGKTRDLC